MEPVTHFLLGANLGRAGLNRKTALATATLTLAAEAPDLDVVGRFHGSVFGFAHHRGFTHSFLGGFIVSAVVVGFMYLVWRLRGRRTRNHLPPRWGLLYAYSYLACLTHILLDYTNNYGVRPFWPFSERWYSWDIVFIVEPALLGLFILGLIMPGIVSLFRSKSVANRGALASTTPALLALVGVIVVWAVRDYEHGRAINVIQSHRSAGEQPLRISAYPYYWNIFRWYGVAEMPSKFLLVDVDKRSLSSDPAKVEIWPKPAETPVTLAAKQAYLGRVYLDWAQYPVTETTQIRDASDVAYAVHFMDLRYAYPRLRGTKGTLGATVLLDRNLRVVDQYFGIKPETARTPQRP